jgi:tRNA A-37 threonylcarbamoyl transferase component Bud32
MTSKTLYLNPDWHELLASNQLNTFEQFWQLELTAVDEGNIGRGKNGWSKVCIHTLITPEGVPRLVVIKRQSNYRSHTLRHPIRGISTFEKEYAFIRRYQQLGVPAMRAVYCATRQQHGELQAILVTEYLENYRSLFDILNNDHLPRSSRVTITKLVAQLVAQLHEKKLEHRCLFPKHIFIPNDLQQKACLIDLEKTRCRPWGEGRIIRDLTALARRTAQVSKQERILFLRYYLGIPRLDNNAKQLWNKITTRIDKKRTH